MLDDSPKSCRIPVRLWKLITPVAELQPEIIRIIVRMKRRADADVARTAAIRDGKAEFLVFALGARETKLRQKRVEMRFSRLTESFRSYRHFFCPTSKMSHDPGGHDSCG